MTWFVGRATLAAAIDTVYVEHSVAIETARPEDTVEIGAKSAQIVVVGNEHDQVMIELLEKIEEVAETGFKQ